MKKLVLLLVIFTTGILSASAQTNDSTAAASATQTLFNTDAKTIFKVPKLQTFGFYVQPEYQYGQVAGSFTGFAGYSLMFIVNQRFAIGATRIRQISPSFSPKSLAPLYVNSEFDGLKMEYTLTPKKAVHISFPIVLGAGYIDVDSLPFDQQKDYSEYPCPSCTPDGVYMGTAVAYGQYFVNQVGVNVETNVMRGVKLYAGANYRLAFLSEDFGIYRPLTLQTLQGYSVNAGVKVGVFEFSPKKCYNKMKNRTEKHEGKMQKALRNK